MVVITKMPRAKFWSRFIIVGLSERQSHIPFNPYLTELSCVLSNKRPNFQNCFQMWWVDARGHNNRDKPRKCILQIRHFPVDSQPIVKLSFLFASWTSSFGTHISAPKLIMTPPSTQISVTLSIFTTKNPSEQMKYNHKTSSKTTEVHWAWLYGETKQTKIIKIHTL